MRMRKGESDKVFGCFSTNEQFFCLFQLNKKTFFALGASNSGKGMVVSVLLTASDFRTVYLNINIGAGFRQW